MKYYLDPLLQKAVRDRKEEDEEMYECNGRRVSFSALVDYWKQELEAAYAGLQEDLWKAWNWQYNIRKESYLPTEVPYFFSLDNAPAHSFWIKYRTEHISRAQLGTSLLQAIRICPHGHDIHQIPEHAIGCIKAHVKKQLARAVRDGRFLTADQVFTEVYVGAELFDSDAWEGNRERWMHALEIVSRNENQLYQFTYKKQQLRAFGTAGGYAPMIVS